MLLINLNPNLTIKKLIEDFKNETGLDMVIYSGKQPADIDLTIDHVSHFCKTRKSDNSASYFKEIVSYPYNIYVQDFKNKLLSLCDLKVDILSSGIILPDYEALADHISSEVLNAEYDYTKLDALNEKLILIEKDIHSQWSNLTADLNNRLIEPGNWLTDYEIEFSINYFIRKEDYLYDENSDNIVLTVKSHLNKKLWTSLMDDGLDHSSHHIKSGLTSTQCYLFHDLIDHHGLSPKDVTRIGSIWVDVIAVYQHFYDISDNSDCSSNGNETDELFRINNAPYNSLSFENFYLSPENELAYNAAKKIIKSSPVVMNPFILYGNTGTGKTHLLNAIMIKYLEDDPQLKVFYTTASEFTSNFINSIMKNTTREFSNKYRKIDVLIIDDFEYFMKKEETQQEFFRIMSSLLCEKKKVIIASGKNPFKLATISDRINTRLKEGFVAQLEYPSFESRFNFLKSEIVNPDIKLPDDMLTTISENITSFGALKSFMSNLKDMRDLGVILSKDHVEMEIKIYTQPES